MEKRTAVIRATVTVLDDEIATATGQAPGSVVVQQEGQPPRSLSRSDFEAEGWELEEPPTEARQGRIPAAEYIEAIKELMGDGSAPVRSDDLAKLMGVDQPRAAGGLSRHAEACGLIRVLPGVYQHAAE